MKGFVRKPNLPEGFVECLVAGEKYRPLLSEEFGKLGIEVIWLKSAPDLPEGVASHADMSVLHLGGNKILLSKELLDYAPNTVEKLRKMGLNLLFSQKNRGAEYPEDCGLNVCLVRNTAIFCTKTADDVAKKNLLDYTHINVNQGYARCSVCVVDERSVITSDRGISRKIKRAGISVLDISPGYIELEGYGYGFVGGATVKLASDVLAFSGKLDSHPDCERILKFLSDRGVEPCFLTDRPIFDMGGAIPLIER